MGKTIIVSNRLPVSVKKSATGLEFFASSGGLVSAMKAFTEKRGTIWVGWPGLVSDNLTDAEMQQITKKLRGLNCLPVFLTKQQVDDYYSGYSNAILWPLFHNLPADFSKEQKQWKSYKEVNEIFSDVVGSISTPESDIWIHDYQLMLLPELIRSHATSERIGFFLHIPFPEPKSMTKLQNHRQIAKGLLGADLLGFHTVDYASEYIELIDNLNLGTASEDTIDVKGRAIHITDFPIGIDYHKFAKNSRKKEVKHSANQLKKKYKNQKIILTVDRLDPTKGFIERLKAYKTFLSENPELHGKVVMMMLAIPSRSDVAAYIKLRIDVEKLVDEINKKFGTAKWQPIDYMHKSVDFKTLSAMYSVASVAFVAPIKDGMNLVAKEYVASQANSDGVLILSETAGAALELKEALLVNPAKPRTLVDALEKALKMPPKELKRRVDKMQKTIAANNSKTWADGFMTTLKETDHLVPTNNLTKTKTKVLLTEYENATKRLIVFDYDGVLSPFVDDPSKASPSKKVYKKLQELSSNKQNDVAIISGRNKKDLENWFGKLPVILGSEHGSVIKFNKKWESTVEIEDDWKIILKPILEKYAKATPGAFVEEKQNSLVWHYRTANPYYAQKNITIMKSALKPVLRSFNLKLYMGSKILEFKNHKVNKGSAVKTMLAKKPYDFIMILGDDYTDEDMFKAAPKKAHTIKVGRGRSNAKHRIPNQTKVYDLIKQL